MRSLASITCVATLVVAFAQSAHAVPIIFTDRAAWDAAVDAVDAAHQTGTENFDLLPFYNPGLGFGTTTVLGGGGAEIVLPGDAQVGNAGSHVGERFGHLNIKLVQDASDIVIVPPDIVVIPNEGVEKVTFNLTETGNFGFGFDFDHIDGAGNSDPGGTDSHDGALVMVNGVTIDVHASGFLGVIDTAGISSFMITPDAPDPTTFGDFQDIDLLDLEWAFAAAAGTGGIPPGQIPEPASMLLLGLGAAGVAAARRRRSRKA